MKRSLALIPALALMATAAPAFAQGMPMRVDGPPLVAISVTESIDSAPDIATISTGVETRAPTASEAMRQNATAMDKLVATIKAGGIDAKDIQTSGINLSPQYVYGQKGPDGTDLPPKFTGYAASNMLTIKSRAIARLGGLLDRMVAAGATNINGPTFGIDDPQPLEDRARLVAMATGKDRAELYAKAAGYAHVRLVSVTEGGAEPPRPMPVMMAARSADAGAMSKVEPGQIATGVTITLHYALEP